MTSGQRKSSSSFSSLLKKFKKTKKTKKTKKKTEKTAAISLWLTFLGVMGFCIVISLKFQTSILPTISTPTTTTTTTPIRTTTWTNEVHLINSLVEENKIKKTSRRTKFGTIEKKHNWSKCSHILPKLVKHLRFHADQDGLRPVSLYQYGNDATTTTHVTHDNSTIITFPGIDQNSLNASINGESLALVGDSTLYYLTQWITALMKMLNGDDDDGEDSVRDLNMLPLQQLSQNDMHDGQALFTKQIMNKGDSTYSHAHRNQNTTIRWLGMSEFGDHNRANEILQEVFTTLEQMRPTIMVVNMGIHWFHFYNVARNTSAQAIRQWIDYEDFWLRPIYELALRFKTTKLLLFKTTNQICDRKLQGNFMRGRNQYSTSNAMVASVSRENCQKSVLLLGDRFTPQQAADYCANATLTRRSSQQLNLRLKAFVTKIKMLQSSPSSDGVLRVDIFNDYDLQDCRYTQDGLHFHDINMMRIRLLANTIQCYLRDNL